MSHHSKNNVQTHTLLRRWLSVALPRETYTYTPLDPTTDDIRLLILLPGDGDQAEIECLLNHISLAENPLYESLSYAWGDQSEEIGKLILEGKPFPITSNLENALRQLRLPTEPRTLWVDAICINQIDDAEKSHQVHQMRLIYQLASRVIIWLGNALDDSDVAMDLLADIHRIGPENYKASLESARSWDALHRLYRRSWFSRAWVIQETAVSHLDPEVLLGSKTLPWNAFESTRLFVESQIQNTHDTVSTMVSSVVKTTVIAIHNIRQDSSPISPVSDLETLLKRTMTFHATDPRDKVFALLGLAHEMDRESIIPDYSKSVMEVYTELAIHLLSKNINMIYFNTNSPAHDLPSWVPDWSWWTRRWPIWSPKLYKAAGNTVQAGRFSQDHTCTIPALLVDRVSITDEFVPRGPEEIFYKASQLSIVIENIEYLIKKAIEGQPSKKETAALDPEKSDTLWRTLVADKELVSRSSPAPESYREMFQVLRGRSNVPTAFKPDLPLDQRKKEFVQPFELDMQSTMSDQRFFITLNGRIGIGPRHLVQNDLIVVFWGAEMPCVLREKNGHSQFLGATYVHGIMNGEAFVGIETQDQLQERSSAFILR